VRIEAWRAKCLENAVKKILNLAEKFSLITTDGSDCHDPYKKEFLIMCRMRVSCFSCGKFYRADSI
jgi:hypothetical protein